MPKLIKEIEKNSSNKIRVSLTDFKGHDFVDVRVYYEDEDGEYKPTKKGIALKPEVIPEVIEALQKAEKELKNTQS